MLLLLPFLILILHYCKLPLGVLFYQGANPPSPPPPHYHHPSPAHTRPHPTPNPEPPSTSNLLKSIAPGLW